MLKEKKLRKNAEKEDKNHKTEDERRKKLLESRRERRKKEVNELSLQLASSKRKIEIVAGKQRTKEREIAQGSPTLTKKNLALKL
uniref:Putative ovule protein n=1 Tax=Solanum chacoense TaxID=4108 RepID=A0A0V0H972_SOLCH